MKTAAKAFTAGVCALLVVFVLGGVSYLLFKPINRTFQGRNIGEWLRTLSTDTRTAGEPLRILRVVGNKDSAVGTVEVPLSCDLVKTYGLSETNGKFNLIINGDQRLSGCWPATNGNCLLPFHKDDLKPGTNAIQVWFMIQNPSDIDHFLWATGPVSRIVLGGDRATGLTQPKD